MRSKTKLVALVLVLFVAGVLFKIFNLQSFLRDSLAWIAGQGAVGAGFYVLLYILATVLMLPGSLLTLGAGVIYGVVWGSVLVSLSSTLGAMAAFIIGRYFARDWVSRRIESHEKFKAIDSAVGREGWKIVMLTRLSPVFPFNLLNYAYGLTQVSLRDYFFASWIGMIPGTLMYVYLGSLAGDLARVGTNAQARTWWEWIFYIVGLLATVGMTLYVTRLARRALSGKVGEVK